jgi:hypothetical protein
MDKSGHKEANEIYLDCLNHYSIYEAFYNVSPFITDPEIRNFDGQSDLATYGNTCCATPDLGCDAPNPTTRIKTARMVAL